MINISALAAAAAHYDAGDPRRVQHFIKVYGSAGRASVSKTECRGFDPYCPCQC